ncbi:phage late control D family protein [Burkholderia sp. TSV86]|uniref:phage late control D family protein n=1 Tax=Burkholderia sp. TSV86 TaxID=1385594 RepID=UPI0007576B90|nr:contractile injection system protein, VgrG/Pvc8 family [Burkholderia sp. TSV86]KVE33911.1 phage tail protein [Burkholderia sp. TSV86]
MGLTQPVRPNFKLVANDRNITATILDRFISLSLTDETGNTSDMLEFSLSDHDPATPIQFPPTGAQLQLFLGYDGASQPMGSFIVDEIELSGWPGVMHIRARAAAYDMGNGGEFHLQTQKIRSWKAGVTIGGIVQKIAREHGMTGAVSASLAGIQLPHIDQQDESDLNLLLRVVAKKYDAVVKPAGSKLVVAKRGEFKSVSGQDLPTITLQARECSRWTMTQQRRETAGTVVAYYHAVKQAKRHIVTVGSGEPVRRIKQYFPTQDQAVAAAKAELAKRTRGMLKMTLTCPGRADLAAESQVNLRGWRDGVPTTWIATRVEHTLDTEGYVCHVELEQPNAGRQGAVDDAV